MELFDQKMQNWQESSSKREQLATIPDLTSVIAEGQPIIRHQVAGAATGKQPKPVLPGTEQFADSWLVDWHRELHHWRERDVAVYCISNAIVSGDGEVWLNDRLITSEEVMPRYVASLLDIENGGNGRVHHFRSLPIRTIDEPCLVAFGHGTKIYGHFLIEMLFRILIAQRLRDATGQAHRVLLRHDSPAWLLKILTDDLNISTESIIFCRNQQERILLRHGIVPTLVLQGGRFLPSANEMIEEMLLRIRITGRSDRPRRIFATRRHFQNPASPFRICSNEARLIEIAEKCEGFTSLAMEEMSWRNQIALFRDATIVIGLAGSALHNAIFSQSDSRLASIGAMNLVQSQLGALRGQRNAFFSRGVNLTGHFNIDEDAFRSFISYVCAP